MPSDALTVPFIERFSNLNELRLGLIQLAAKVHPKTLTISEIMQTSDRSRDDVERAIEIARRQGWITGTWRIQATVDAVMAYRRGVT